MHFKRNIFLKSIYFTVIIDITYFKNNKNTKEKKTIKLIKF